MASSANFYGKLPFGPASPNNPSTHFAGSVHIRKGKPRPRRSARSGRPPGVQGMRYEGHGWDPKGPASIHHARAALDKDGAVIGYAFESKGFSRIDIDTNESDPSTRLPDAPLGKHPLCDDEAEQLFLRDPYGNMIELHQVDKCRCRAANRR